MDAFFVAPLLGGILIGIGATLLLALDGKVLGVSGIVGGLLDVNSRRQAWRWAFLLGMLLTGGIVFRLWPEALQGSPVGLVPVIVAGLLVGYGTRLGNGCTSGHGVCGMSRLSRRSIVATLVFMATGILTVLVMKGL
jgi:uncharacterized membrane protein YedE/YeeE